MKNLSKLNGAKALSKSEQKEVFGGCRGCGGPGAFDGSMPDDSNPIVTSSCPGPHPIMPGKCFDLRWCRYVYGMPNAIGNCQ